MSSICTNIDQSRRLLELGLPADTADMMYQQYETIIGDDYGYKLKLVPYYSDDIEGVPAWTLNALLEAIPQSLNMYDDSERCYKNYEINLFRSYYHCCSYSFGPSLKEENHDNLCCFGDDTWMDAVLKTVQWLFENGHMKRENKKDQSK